MPKTVGILAFQGGVIEHAQILKQLGVKTIEVKNIQDLKKVDSLIIPGGESTTIGFFLEETGLLAEIKKRSFDQKNSIPIFGTCAGAIILAKKIIGKKIPPNLGLLNIEIERNAYGTQSDSFYTELSIPKLKIKDLKAVFIRAPIIKNTTEDCQILAKHKNQIILVQQKNILAATFHPELANDTRLHEYFVKTKHF